MQNDSGINKKIFQLPSLTKEQYFEETKRDHKTKAANLVSKLEIIKKEIEKQVKDYKKGISHVK